MAENPTGAENTSPGNGASGAQPDFAALASEIAGGVGGSVPALPDSVAPPKRGPGRPPKHGRYSRAAGSNGKSPVRITPGDGEPVAHAGPAPVPADGGDAGNPLGEPRLVRLPPALVARLARIPWAKLDKLGRDWLRSKSAKLPDTLRPEAEKLIEATGFSPDELEILCEITPLVLEEWELGGGEFFTPTTALGIIVAFKALDVFNASRTLERLAEGGGK